MKLIKSMMLIALLFAMQACSKKETINNPVPDQLTEVTNVSMAYIGLPSYEQVNFGNKGRAVTYFKYAATNGTVNIIFRGKNGRDPIESYRGASSTGKTFDIQDGDTIIVTKLDGSITKYITRLDGISGSIYIDSPTSQTVDQVRTFFSDRFINPSRNYWKE
jgi:hypothetical protein